MSTADTLQHIWWEEGSLFLLDQRLLPAQAVIARCATVEDVVRAIRTMQVRGAPACR
jgi:methylthioribose-1-phosphate isomerase